LAVVFSVNKSKEMKTMIDVRWCMNAACCSGFGIRSSRLGHFHWAIPEPYCSQPFSITILKQVS
jgi:hypothetical protein